jgi:hypothetical protein
MKYDLKTNYRGRFHAIPNILIDFLPCDTYVVFTRIYIAGKEPLCDKRIKISQRVLSKQTLMGFGRITKCIAELQKLDFVKAVIEEHKSAFFQINWDEITALENFAKNISSEGLALVKKKCFNEPITPFSKLDNSYLQKIQQDYPFKYENYQNTTSENFEAIADIDTPISQVERRQPSRRILKRDDGSYVLQVVLSDTEKMLAEFIPNEQLKIDLVDDFSNCRPLNKKNKNVISFK